MGTVHGMRMPAGLRHADRLPEPIFTPSTKAAEGHDLNIGMAEAIDLVGKEAAEAASELCLAAYSRAAARAEDQGIVICDTKFELGFIDGALSLCDEVLTPDSSRFWPADDCAPGTNPPSFDKQPLRDWLEAQPWDKQPPPPPLPDEIVTATSRRYVDAYERICGRRSVRLVRCVTVASSQRFSVLVEVRLREGIADPQGATIERALPALGLSGVTGVRAGKAFRFDIAAADDADALAQATVVADRLLANPVIEESSVTAPGRDGEPGRRRARSDGGLMPARSAW